MSDTDRQQRLRERLSAESRRLLDTIDEMHELEELKRAEDVSTPAFHSLAEEISRKGRDVFRITTIQESIGDSIESGTVSMNDVRPQDSHRETGRDEADRAVPRTGSSRDRAE